MPNNELVLLNQILQQRQDDRDEPLPDDKAFELFACEQALRNFDLSEEEVAAGLVGGGNDGGLDGIYVFLGDTLLSEDSEIFVEGFTKSRVPTSERLLLCLVQAKREGTFRETVFDTVSASTKRLLDLNETDEDLGQIYSETVVRSVGLFKQALRKLAVRHVKPEVRFSYASRGNVDEIHSKVLIKSRDLEASFRQLTSDAVGSVEFLGAAELRGRASTVPSYTLQLTFKEQATAGEGYVAIVQLDDYLRFLSEDDGSLRRHIFDWNVRDYEGDVEVNKEIRQSLEDPDGPEFWWLNNGVTVLCSNASSVGKTFTLDDVQIVNGLQTSQTIHRVLHDADQSAYAMSRSLLVRIVVTDDPKTRDRIIRATNRQTSVPAASLRATDPVQRSIETFFLGSGWFYDRRKNFYRNMGKSPDRIIGIPLLAQATMSMGLGRPDNSRARPSSLLKRDDDYESIFSPEIDLKIYLWAARAQKAVDRFLLQTDATATERTNLRFHLSMFAATRLHGSRISSPSDLAGLAEADRQFSNEELNEWLDAVREAYRTYEDSSGNAMDKIAKGREFVETLITAALRQADVGAPSRRP